MRDLNCRLPGSRLPFVPRPAKVKTVRCPNCGEKQPHVIAQEKANCRRCGNVWAWARRGSGVVSLLRRAG